MKKQMLHIVGWSAIQKKNNDKKCDVSCEVLINTEKVYSRHEHADL